MWFYAPAVRGEQADIARTSVGRKALALRIVGRRTDQKVGEIHSRFRAVKCEVAVRPPVVFGQLVVSELPTEGQRMRSDHSAEVVHDLKRSLGDPERPARSPK